MKPRLKPYLAFAPLDAENVLVRGPGVFLRYSGEAVPVLRAMLPLLDGTRGPAEIAREAKLAEQDVLDVLEGMRGDKLVEDAERDDALQTPAPAAALSAWSVLSALPHRAQNRVASARFAVLGEGELAAEAERHVRAAGALHVARDMAGADHALALADAPAPARFAEVNERALAAGVPVTYAFLDGVEATIGPTVIPRQAACWRCYELRAKGAHPNHERLLAFEASRASAPADPRLATFAPIVGAWAAQAALVAVAGVSLPPLAGHVVRARLLDMDARRHRVLRLPRCPACSDADVPDVDRYALEPLG